MNNFFKNIFGKIYLGGLFQRRISIAEKMLFSKHLSIMIRAGMPLLDSLWLLKKQARSKSFQKILDTLIVDVDNGQFLSAGLEKHRSIFGNFFINIIRVGEASGSLVDNLNYLHEELRKSYELKRKVKSAMMYPIIIFAATLGISAILMFFVLPKIIPVFSSFKIQLPITTRILIAVINFFTDYGLYAVLGILAIIVLILLLLKIKAVKFALHRLFLSLPFIGRVSRGVNMVAFSRTFFSLLKSGIKIVDAVLITADTMPNLVYQRELKQVVERVKNGESISSYFLQAPQFFPLIFSQMIEVGENTGRLDENLRYLADFYEAEVDEVFKNLSTILEPILLLLMGIMVGFIAISIISPIYSITQSFKIN